MAGSRHTDILVIGGGTAGAALAGRLAERLDRSITLLEAGPDYGPVHANRWPADLRDATVIPTTHQWGYSTRTLRERDLPLERARVIGGCSAHNGCIALWGSALDYDGWARAGNPGWATDDLRPFFAAVERQLRVSQPPPDQVTPFQAACVEAMIETGIPPVDDLNNLEENVGVAPAPRNVVDTIRWNAAFAYLDPVRDRPNLTIVGSAMVDRVLLDGGRVRGAVAQEDGGEFEIEADIVILAAGAYGSPAILLRSGIGDPRELEQVGIRAACELTGVGKNLQDHPAVELLFSGTEGLRDRMATFARSHWTPEEQVLAKARSPLCREAFDLHVYPVSSPTGGDTWSWRIPVACMDPHSRGTVRLTGDDPHARPVIDHLHLSDPEGHDRAVLAAGVDLVREIAAHEPLAAVLGEEIGPGRHIQAGDALAEWIDRTSVHYYHPAGTCKMGPATDGAAVVDPRGQVHGIEGLYVADCSIIPVIPRANTNLPAALIGERIAGWLVEDL